MGNLCVSNEPTFADKLREQLCHIAQEYESLELICGYIGIFEMVLSSSNRVIQSADSSTFSPIGHHSSSYSYYAHTQSQSVHHANHEHEHQSEYNAYDEHNHHHNEADSSEHRHHHNNSSTRSNLKVKEKKEIQILTDLDYAQFYQWKIEQVYKVNPNITDQELKSQYGLIVNASSNNILSSIHLNNNPLIDIGAKIANISNDSNQDDEKEKLLKQQQQQQNQQQGQKGSAQKALPSMDAQQVDAAAPQQQSENEMISIKNILKNNDIKSSVQSLGDTTNQLCEILDRAKILHKMRDDLAKKVIHIRGNKQTIFSYYLLLNRYIIISYAQYKSECLEFGEWIKIQGKLEKLEITLKDIEALLNERK